MQFHSLNLADNDSSLSGTPSCPVPRQSPSGSKCDKATKRAAIFRTWIHTCTLATDGRQTTPVSVLLRALIPKRCLPPGR
uniref:Uncharacterized protein n=1 Tax=Oryza glumipatula TaxID=40148 RepID=A0A0D9YZF9_9ORYZ